MAYSNLRKTDMSVEQEVAKFLDKSLYQRKDIFTNVIRNYNEETQFKGQDITFSIPKLGFTNIVVDEKAQTDYIGNPRPSFVLELSFLNYLGNVQKGWFVDEDNQTDFYLFIWINKAKKTSFVKEEDIEEIEFCLVNKNKLKFFFENQNYNVQQLIKKSEEIRKNGIFGPLEQNVNPHFFFYYTEHKMEKPINIVVRKHVYLNLADLSGTVCRDYINRVFHINLYRSI